MLYINGGLVRELLTIQNCEQAMKRALCSLAEGASVQPLRDVMWLPDRHGLLGSMPAYLAGEPDLMGIKVVSVIPGNRAAGLPSHQGLVILFEPADGQPVAVLDADSITAIRTAAVSALATRALARDVSSVLAILGSGTQAAVHLEAMSTVRDIESVRVWSRYSGRAQQFAAAARHRYHFEIKSVPTAEIAVRNADLICTLTAAREPILCGEWLADGTHINAVGATVQTSRELDVEAVRRARLIVDRRESALAEAGDFLLARREGAIDDDHIAGELGEVLTGRVAGRRSDGEITLFESLGLAVEDLAAARLVYDNAMASGKGIAL